MKRLDDYTKYNCQFINQETGEVCGKPACKSPSKRKDGTHAPRRYKGKVTCSTCFNEDIYKGAGYESTKDYQKQNHPYANYRKDCCENQDGRLGFECTFKPPSKEQLKAMGLSEDFKTYLQVDHIDGNPYNNDPENLQTLCGNCHVYKTAKNGDRETPGRKTGKSRESRVSSIKKINKKEKTNLERYFAK